MAPPRNFAVALKAFPASISQKDELEYGNKGTRFFSPSRANHHQSSCPQVFCISYVKISHMIMTECLIISLSAIQNSKSSYFLHSKHCTWKQYQCWCFGVYCRRRNLYSAKLGNCFFDHHLLNNCFQMFDVLNLDFGLEINLMLVPSVPRGKFVKIQPHETAFIDLPDPRAV